MYKKKKKYMLTKFKEKRKQELFQSINMIFIGKQSILKIA